MSRYVKEAFHQFGHKTPMNPQHQPYPDPEWTYGAYTQKMKPLDTSPSFPMERMKKIECIIGKFVYYARGVYNTFLVPLSTMATINDPTEQYEKTYTNFWITWQQIQM